jgi:RNA polymerase sigma factor (sigma-70 family)
MIRLRRRPSRQTGLEVDAFLRAYDAHCESLLRFFARRVLVADAAADLTAETFAEAFASRRQFDPNRGDLSAWLYGIARHKLADYLRHLAVERRARDRIGVPDRTLGPEDHERIEALIDFASIATMARAALGALPPEQRSAVAYRIIDERPYDEIAGLLGCSEQTARARVSRGLRLLARSLSTLNDDPRGGACAHENDPVSQ